VERFVGGARNGVLPPGSRGGNSGKGPPRTVQFQRGGGAKKKNPFSVSFGGGGGPYPRKGRGGGGGPRFFRQTNKKKKTNYFSFSGDLPGGAPHLTNVSEIWGGPAIISCFLQGRGAFPPFEGGGRGGFFFSHLPNPHVPKLTFFPIRGKGPPHLGGGLRKREGARTACSKKKMVLFRRRFPPFEVFHRGDKKGRGGPRLGGQMKPQPRGGANPRGRFPPPDFKKERGGNPGGGGGRIFQGPFLFLWGTGDFVGGFFMGSSSKGGGIGGSIPGGFGGKEEDFLVFGGCLGGHGGGGGRAAKKKKTTTTGWVGPQGGGGISAGGGQYQFFKTSWPGRGTNFRKKIHFYGKFRGKSERFQFKKNPEFFFQGIRK